LSQHTLPAHIVPVPELEADGYPKGHRLPSAFWQSRGNFGAPVVHVPVEILSAICCAQFLTSLTLAVQSGYDIANVVQSSGPLATCSCRQMASISWHPWTVGAESPTIWQVRVTLLLMFSVGPR
jgi:hypothetical protein